MLIVTDNAGINISSSFIFRILLLKKPNVSEQPANERRGQEMCRPSRGTAQFSGLYFLQGYSKDANLV